MEKPYNPFSLEGKTVIVTGASSGIGKECAISCSKMGAKVALVARNQERLNETLSLMEGDGHFALSFDLTNLDGIPDAVNEIVEHVGKISGLLNCAGVSTTKLFKLTKPEELDDLFHSNVYSGYFLTQEVCKMWNLAKGGASVVFFSSIAGMLGEVGKSTYGMTKAALLNLTKHLACELAHKKVRVNSVSPGVICTPINMNLPHMKDPVKRAALESKHLLGFGETTDIANACIYLLSDASRWMTGHNLVLDGGYSVV